jgi:two-component system OmpR family sensor kinase
MWTRWISWIRDHRRRPAWTQRLVSQLVLSHVFVAVMVLAFAFGVAQVTFRHYLVESELNRLTTQGEAIERLAFHGFFEGALGPVSGIYLVDILQGTLNDRVYVTNDVGQTLLETQRGHVPTVPLPLTVLSQVLEQGQIYRGVLDGKVAIVGVPALIGPGDVAGGVFLESPLTVTNRTANSLTRLLLFGELAAVILVGALAYTLSWRMAKPLDDLRQVVAGTGQGGEPAGRALEGEGPFEVQALAQEFNRLQDRIETQMAQLKREAEARDALMAHVAHDLRTPLTSIRGFLEAVRDGVAVGEGHDRAVEIAWEETLRLQRLVNRLLRATRIRSESGPMAPVAVDAWVEKTLERIRPVLADKGLDLVWERREAGTIWGNEDYLLEALVNVLDNAVKWSPVGGRIVVETLKDGDHMIVRVTDQGPGIPPELLPRVFERFVTGDASRQQSSGLGLSIVDEVIQQHGGSVHIDSRPGAGTAVSFYLPLYHDEVQRH